MENQESSTYKKFEDEKSFVQYKRHGIPLEFFTKWFGNYDTGKDKALRKRIDHLIVRQRRGHPVALIGDVGQGKTHLACAILKDAIICHDNIGKPFYREQPNGDTERMYPKIDSPGHYYTMTQLNRDFRMSMQRIENNENEKKCVERLTAMKCLVIDELQIRSKTDSEQRMFQEILDTRHTSNKQTIFVGNVTAEELSNILGERLLDRLKQRDLMTINFTGDSYRAKK